MTYSGAERTFTVYSDGSGPLKASIVWTDPPPSSLPSPGLDVTTPVLVNNLNMTITGPASTTYYPWRLDPANPTANAIRTVGTNNVDNVEQVLIDAPAAGYYTIRVSGPSAFTQNFSLLVTGGKATTSITLDGSNNLVVTDSLGTKNDSLSIRADSANSRFVITDANSVLATSISGATGTMSNTIFVPYASVAGSKIIVNTMGGNDTLTIDHSLGLFPKAIEYNGGNPTTGPGDKLVVTGGSFAKITHTFTAADSGNIALTGSGTITYTGLEPVDQTGSTAGDLVFNLPDTGVDNDAFLEDDGNTSNNISQLRSGNGKFELTTFSNPTNSITINRGRAGDDLTIAALPNFNRTLIVGSVANPFDVVTVTGLVVLNAGFASQIDATTIALSSSSSALVTQGSGNNTLRAVRNISMVTNSSVFAQDGAILMQANQGGSPVAGNFKGVDIGGVVRTTGAGNITIAGRGGNDAGTSGHVGVYLAGATVKTDGSGKIAITGTAGIGDTGNNGVSVTFGTTVFAAANDLSITGTADGTAFSGNTGVVVDLGAQVTAGSAGTLAIKGTAAAAGNSTAVRLEGSGAKITTTGAHITVDAIGGGTGGQNLALDISSSMLISAGGLGNVTLTGTRGANAQGATGVYIVGNSVVSTAGGNLSVIGNGAGGKGSGNIGVRITLDAALSTGGSGKLSITGVGGVEGNFNHGVVFGQAGASTSISTAGGDIEITGSSQSAGTTEENWGIEFNTSVISAGGSGKVTINGTGGKGTFANYGVRLWGGAEIKAASGSISLTGKGGVGTGIENIGVDLIGARVFTTAGNGGVIVNGTGGAGTDKNYGVRLYSGGNKVTTFGGNISVTGTAGGGTGIENRGVTIGNGFLLSAGGVGTITVDGTGGVGNSFNYGVAIENANTIVGTVAGAITITGTGKGAKTSNFGTWIALGANVTAGSGGKITITGTSGAGTDSNTGVLLENANTKVSTGFGDLSITGISKGTGSLNTGVVILGAAVVSSTNGKISIDGTGGNGGSANESDGVAISNTAQVTNAGNSITVTGKSFGGGNNNFGINIASAAVVSTTGTGALAGDIVFSGTGTAAGTSDNYGVSIKSGSTVVSTADGSISITGTAQGKTTANIGVNVTGGLVSAGGTGELTITAYGGEGTTGNHGIQITGAGTIVKANFGDWLWLQGTGGGSGGVGVLVRSGARVESTGSAPVTLFGSGSQGSGGNNQGVVVQDIGTFVGTANSALSITGVGLGTGSNNRGISITAAAVVSTGGSGALTVNGQGGNGASDNTGIFVSDANTKLITAGGNIEFIGTGSGTGSGAGNIGIQIVNAAVVTAGGSGKMKIDGLGGPGTDGNSGVVIAGAGTSLSTGGLFEIFGQANGGGLNNYGVTVRDGAQCVAGGTGAIFIDGEGGAGTNSNIGVDIGGTNTKVSTSDGKIDIIGTSLGTGTSNYGVNVRDAALCQAGGTGAVTINGTGGKGTASNCGVQVAGAGTFVKSTAGDLSVTGTGRGSANDNYGVIVYNGPVVSAGGSGKLTVNGTGANGTTGNRGVFILAAGSTLQTVDGLLSIIGNGGGNGSSNHGVEIHDTAVVASTGIGAVSVNGTSGNGSNSNNGVLIDLPTTKISTAKGNIDIIGISNGTGASNVGVAIRLGAQANAGGSGKLSITGTGGNGTDNNYGVLVSDVSTQVTTAGGAMDIIGTGRGNGGFSHGVEIFNDAVVSTALGGQMSITGTGSSGGGAQNHGVLITGNAVAKTFAGFITLKGYANKIANGDTGVLILSSVQSTSGNASIFGDSIEIAGSGAVNVGSKDVAFVRLSNNQQLNLGAADSAGILGLTDAELDRVTAGRIVFVSNNLGKVTVSGAITRSAATKLQVDSGAGIDFAGGSLNSAGADVQLSSSGSITTDASGTDVTANLLYIQCGAGNVGSSTNPLRMAATTLLTVANSPNVNQFYHEADTVGLSGLSAAGGTITFMNGQFDWGGPNVVNDDTSLVVNGAAAKLEMSTFSDTVQGVALIDGTISGSSAVLTSASGFDVRNGKISVALAGNVGLVKSTSGTVTFEGNPGPNSYTGTTFVNDGVLILNRPFGSPPIPGNLVIGDGSGPAATAVVRQLDEIQFSSSTDVTINADGQLETDGKYIAMDGLSGTGVISNIGVVTEALALGTNNHNGAVFSGIIQDGAGKLNLFKGGSGAQTLAGNNSYTGGTTIGAGTLLVTGSLAAGSTVQVMTSSTLGGTGTVSGPVLVDAGGTVDPGVTTGKLSTGIVTFDSASTFKVQFEGNGAGQFDSLSSSGTIALNGASLVFGGSYGPVNGDSFIIVDAATAVTGEFAGLPNGSTVFINGRAMEITYGSKTVTLAYDATPVIRTGNLDNDIVIRKDAGGNIEVVVDSVTILDVPETELTSLTIQSEGGNDILTLDHGFAGGKFFVPITLDGGADTDTVRVLGNGYLAIDVLFSIDAGNGTIALNDGSKTATAQFKGIEPLDLTGAGTAELNFILADNSLGMLPANKAVLEDDGTFGNGATRLRSVNSRFNTASFSNPTQSVAIFSGDPLDQLMVASLSDFTASLHAGDLSQTGKTFDLVTIDGIIQPSADRDVLIEATTIRMTSNAVIALQGIGEVGFTPNRAFQMNPSAVLSTVDGEIFIEGAGPGDTGAFAGVDIDAATIQTTGKGAINITGRGGLGIRLQNSAQILTTGSGDIDLFGFRTDGAGKSQSHGVAIIGSGTKVSSKAGYVNILGDSATTDPGDSGIGVVIDAGALVESQGLFNVTVEGYGRDNIGVDIVGAGSTVRSENGKVEIIGYGHGDGQTGVMVLNGARVESTGAGEIVIDGLGSNGVDHNHGVVIDGKNTLVTTGGNLSVSGTGRGSGAFNMGVSIQIGARLVVNGVGTVSVTGATSASSTPALRIVGDDGAGTSSGITAGGGDVTITADEIDLGIAESITGSGKILLQPLTANRPVVLGGSGNVAGKLTLTTGDLAAIDQTSAFSSITIGRSDSSGGITTQSDVAFAIDTLLRNPNASNNIVVGNKVSTGSSNLTVQSGGSIETGGSGLLQAATLDLSSKSQGIGVSGDQPLLSDAGTLHASAEGSIFVSNAKSLSVGVVQSAASDVDVRTSNGHIQFGLGASVVAKNGGVTLRADDDLNVASGTPIEGVNINLAGGTGGTGSINTLFGVFTTANPIAASGGAGADTFILNGSAFAFAIDGLAGSDTLDFATIVDPVDVDISGVGTIDGYQGKINLSPISTFDNIDVFVNIVGPTADAGGPYTINEGQSLVLNGTKSQSASGLPLSYAWELDGDNDFNDAFGATPTITWAQLQSFGIDDGIPPGSNFTVWVRVTDGITLPDDDDAPLTLNNSAPTASFTQDASPRIERRPTTVRFSNQFDHSTADTNAGWTYSYDFNNDGDYTDPGDISGSKSAAAQFTFPFEGSYPVRGRITDKDGGFTEYVITVKINNVDVFSFGAEKNFVPRVRVLDASSGLERFNFLAFPTTFLGGVRVASGDINNDGIPDIIAASGAGIATTVRVFDGVTGAQKHEFQPFGATVKNGAFVTVGDLNADGFVDIVVGSDSGMAPLVRGYDGKQLAQSNKVVQLFSFAPYAATFKGGVRVAGGDFDGDGKADIITAPGSGLTTQVKVFGGVDQKQIAGWTAFNYMTAYTGGAFISAGDTDGDGKAEITVSQGATTTPRVQMYRGGDAKMLVEMQPFAGFSPGPTGIRTLMQDRDGDGKMDLIVAPGPGLSRVKVYKGNLLSLLSEFDPFASTYLGGVYVG